MKERCCTKTYKRGFITGANTEIELAWLLAGHPFIMLETKLTPLYGYYNTYLTLRWGWRNGYFV